MSKLKFKPIPEVKPKAKAGATEGVATVAAVSKVRQIVQRLRRPEGVDLPELMALTGWQAHSVRGALSGAIKSKLKMNVVSSKTDSGRVYRIVEETTA